MSSEAPVETIDGEPGAPEADPRRPYVWQQRLRPSRSGEQTGIDGALLAALRRGIGREAGSVPEMWPYYRELTPDGRLTRRLQAEHLTMALFAVHQQSKSQPVHHQGIGVGTAMAALRDAGRFSAEAVDRRFASFATATSLAEAGTHLRGLITQLRDLDQGRLDYTKLFHDLVEWQYPESTGKVRRRWGSQYFAKPAEPTKPEDS